MTSATFINANQLAVAGDVLDTFRIGTRIKLDQAADGLLLTDVAAAVYDDANSRTVITCQSGTLTSNLLSIQHGWTFVDPTNHESNVALHYHAADWDGGTGAFGLFTDQGQVESLLVMATVDDTVANNLIGVNSAGTSIEKKAITGTTGQVVVTHGTREIGLSLPQSIRTNDTPTFAGVNLSGFSGVVLAQEGALTSLAASSGGRALITSADNGSFVFLPFALANLTDVDTGTPENNHVLTWDSTASKWTPQATPPPPAPAGSGDAMLFFMLSQSEEI